MSTETLQKLEDWSALIRDAAAAGRGSLNEWEAKQLLAAYDVPVPRGGLARSEEDAVGLAAGFGGPVALKAIGDTIHHKTEAGLVALGLRTSGEVANAYKGIKQRVGDELEAVLVEEMVAGSREFLVGMQRDPAFGPVVLFGLGGVMTEVFRDVALAPSPGTERDVTELFDLIRSRELLGAFRGQPAVDRRRLAQIVLAVAHIAEDHPEIREIDVNPLIIAGDRPVAADALVILGDPSQEAAPPSDFRPDLRAVCAPRSVAVVGASDNVDKWGGSALRNILDGGFEGPVYPVNPKGGEFFGLPVYASLEELPEAPDMALIAVGGAQIPAVLEQCGRRGVRVGVVIAAGFSETGAEGRQVEQDLAERAADGGCHADRPQLHGAGLQRDPPARHRLHRLAPSPGSAQLRLSIGQPRRADRQGMRTPRDRSRQVHQRRQRGAGELHRRARLPAHDDPHRRACCCTWRASTTGAAFSTSPRRPLRSSRWW